MTHDTNGHSGPSWRWLVGILVSIVAVLLLGFNGWQIRQIESVNAQVVAANQEITAVKTNDVTSLKTSQAVTTGRVDELDRRLNQQEAALKSISSDLKQIDKGQDRLLLELQAISKKVGP